MSDGCHRHRIAGGVESGEAWRRFFAIVSRRGHAELTRQFYYTL